MGPMGNKALPPLTPKLTPQPETLKASSTHNMHFVYGSFRKLVVPYFGGPHNKDIRVPYFRKLPHTIIYTYSKQ